jgi:hypothetical protein
MSFWHSEGFVNIKREIPNILNSKFQLILIAEFFACPSTSLRMTNWNKKNPKPNHKIGIWNLNPDSYRDGI